VSNTSGTSSGDLRAFTDYVVDVKTLHRAIAEVKAARENAETRDAAETGLWGDRTPESHASRASRVPSYRVTDPAIPKSRRVLLTARMLSLFVVAAAVYAIEQIPVTESFRMPSHVSLHVGLLTIGQWVAAPPAVALRFPQFAGIVGYEPSARRGLLVDTGAAINIHGSEWAKHYLEEVLSPNQRTMQKEAGGESVSGVSGKSASTSKTSSPVAIRAFSYASNSWTVLKGDYKGNEVEGPCPGLLCFDTLQQLQALIDCWNCTMDITVGDGRYNVPMVHTLSGHLIMPTDNFSSEEATAEPAVSLFAREELIQGYGMVPEEPRPPSMEALYEGVDWSQPLEMGRNFVDSYLIQHTLQESAKPHLEAVKPEEKVREDVYDAHPSDLPPAPEEEWIRELTEAESRFLYPERWRKHEMETAAFLRDNRFRWTGIAEQDDTEYRVPGSDPPTIHEFPQVDILGKPAGMDWDDRQKWHFWEIFSGSQKLTEAAGLSARMAAGTPVDYNTGWDLSNEKHQAALRDLQLRHRPAWVHISMTGHSWKLSAGGKAQQMARNFLREKDERALPFLEEMVRAQYDNNRSFSLAEPKDFQFVHHSEVISRLKEMSEQKDFQEVHLCAHGLKDPTNGVPVKRPVMILSSEHLVNAARVCPGPDKHPLHSSYRSHFPSRSFGKWMPQTRWVTGWNDGFARRFVRDVYRSAFRRHLEGEPDVYLADEHTPTGVQRCNDNNNDDNEVEEEQRERQYLDEVFPVEKRRGQCPANITCSRCKAHWRNDYSYSAPHTRLKGCQFHGIPFRPPFKAHPGAKRVTVKAKAVAKPKGRPPKAAVPPKASVTLLPPPPRAGVIPEGRDLRQRAVRGLAESSSSSSSSSSGAGAEGSDKRTPLSRSTREPRYVQVFERMVDLVTPTTTAGMTGPMQPSETRFYDTIKTSEAGKEAVRDLLPSDVVEVLKGIADPDGRYDIPLVQWTRLPKLRRAPLPHASVADLPWRFSLMLHPSKTVQVESWVKLHGTGSLEHAETPIAGQPLWMIVLHGKPQTEHPSPSASSAQAKAGTAAPEEAQQGPVSLGRMTKALTSTSEAMQLRGLTQLHRRFWHASKERMRLLLDRAGICLDDELLTRVVRLCRPCRLWSKCPSVPKSHVSGPTELNEEVEFDLFFYDDFVFSHFIDVASRWSRAMALAGRDWGSIVVSFFDWYSIFGNYMKRLISDQESAVFSDEGLLFLERKGVKAKPIAKDEHLGIVERRQDVLKRTMNTLHESAEQEGIVMETPELLSEALVAANSLTEYGGFSPQQAVTGSNPDSSGLIEAEDDPVGSLFAKAFRSGSWRRPPFFRRFTSSACSSRCVGVVRRCRSSSSRRARRWRCTAKVPHGR
jgi:hypothetical protein